MYFTMKEGAMKIIPVAEPGKTADNAKVKKQDNSSKKQFGSVLNEVISSNQTEKTVTTNVPLTSIRSVMHPQVSEKFSKGQLFGKVEGLIDLLEDFRGKLIDPGVTLRHMNRVIEHLKAENKNLESGTQILEQGDELKGIVEQTRASVSMEIMKYNNGYYNDP